MKPILTEKDLNKLTKHLLVHMIMNDMCTMKKVRKQALFMEKSKFPCWDCVAIFRKLKVPCDLKAFHEKLQG